MKSALELLKKRVLASSQGPDENNYIEKVRVTYQIILDVYEAKHGSKIEGTLRSQPR